MSEPEDPARRFLDQTVPKHDEWDGREPDDGPARPRHVQHPEPVETFGAKQRRTSTIRNLAWGVGPSAAFVAGAALSDDDVDIEVSGNFGDAGSGL
ncbi:hypothetical protein [Actinophytocola glycyrrhizae]|uniref:Uncharacterized protein n=1 Tax=Actinophytocola glycyrrhizae TaxID=2044873 RepID=A0ABV9S920_9PSEU